MCKVCIFVIGVKDYHVGFHLHLIVFVFMSLI